MLLAIDIGNSNISVGLFDRQRELRFLASLDTDSRKTADHDYLRQALEEARAEEDASPETEKSGGTPEEPGSTLPGKTFSPEPPPQPES